MRDIPMFPIFPERLDVEMVRAGIGKDLRKGSVGAVAYTDQRAEDVERHHCRPQTRAVRCIAHRSPPDDCYSVSATGVSFMVSPLVIATVSIANWWASLVPGINHESADKPTGLAACFVSSLRVLFDRQCPIEANQPDGASLDVDVK